MFDSSHGPDNRFVQGYEILFFFGSGTIFVVGQVQSLPRLLLQCTAS